MGFENVPDVGSFVKLKDAKGNILGEFVLCVECNTPISASNKSKHDKAKCDKGKTQ